MLLRWGLALLLCAVTGVPLRATPVVDNNAGYFFDDYADNGGIISSSQVQISPPGTVSLVPANTSGSYITRSIEPSSFSAWGKLTLEGSYGAQGDLKVEVLDRFGSPLVPPMLLPWNNVPIILSGLDPAQVPGIQVRVLFNKTALVVPTVNSLRVTWLPAAQLLLDKRGPVEVEAGGNVVYSILYSVSYVEGQDLVVWDTLPSASAGTLVPPQPYGQNDDFIYVPGSANSGGQHTAVPLLVHGVNVPANSVYWTFTKVPEGTTDLLSFTVATQNGTLNLTRATNCAFAQAANATRVRSCVVTTIRSASSPFAEKQEGAGIFNIGGVLQTSVGKVNSFHITARNNYQPLGGQTMYNAVVYDDVSDLIAMIEDLAPPGPDSNDFNISGGGVFDLNYPGPTGPIPAIVWNVGALAPGASFSGSFSVQLRVSPPRMQYDNQACLTSDQTGPSPTCSQLTVQLPVSNGTGGPPAAGFRKTASAAIVPYGGTVAFDLSMQNKYAVKLNDVLLLDRMPPGTTFRSAWINAPDLRDSGAKVFYSTSTSFSDQDTPPDMDYTQAVLDDLDIGGNSYWESYALNPPANPADVTWVAFYIPQVDSAFLPNEGTPALPPSTPITAAAVSFDVNVLVPSDPCTDLVLLNHALFRAYELTDLSNIRKVNPNGTLSFTADAQVMAKGYKGKLSAFASIAPDPVAVPGVSTYSATVANDNSATSDALANVEAVLQLSQVAVNGVLQYPSVQAMPIGYSPGPGPGQITVPIGFMAAGATRHLTLPLVLPAGIPNGAEYTVALSVTGRDNQCGFSTATASARGRVQSSPKLSVRKNALADLIPRGATYDYTLQYQNVGTGPSTGTWIVDRIPRRTVLVQAFGNPNITGVWFSYVDTLPPQALTPFDPINASTINNHFTKGELVDQGNTDPNDDYWIPAGGGDPTKVYWAAWRVDSPAVNPPQVTINTLGTVGLRVKNDHDSQGPNTVGSPQNTCWPNSAAIFSSELLQAIGNQVLTCVDDNPSIVVGKTGPSVVEAGVPFQWVVTYHNNTLLNPDNIVSIIDTLPPGITFLSATHQWNDVAAANGAPGGASVQTVAPAVSVQAGSTVLTFPIAGINGYRDNGALQGLEGGTITLTVQSAPATPCRSTRVNTVRGIATTATETKESTASRQVTIACPDLDLLKSVVPATVLTDGTVTYQLELANRGGIPARDVAITDLLPEGVTYVGPLTVLPTDYTLAEPIVNGQTLTWSVANGRALTHTGRPPGEIPVTMGNIVIRFDARLGANIAACSSLTNWATVTSASRQEGLYTNSATATATVPPPELSVAQSGPALALPGTRMIRNISWANSSLQPATGVYWINTLPDSNMDGISDVTFVRVDVPAGTLYYHSGPVSQVPDFNPANPLDPANNWSTIATVPVNHIALLVGSLPGNAGPFNAELTMDLLDPITQVRPDAGVCFTNRVTIRQAVPDCEDTSDNTATAVVCTPKLDLALTKTGSPQGPLPGIAPGQPITYTLSFRNSGTVPARGVRVRDTLPDGLLKGNPLDNFTVLTLVDPAGSSCSPVNHLTDLPIVGDVPVTRETNGNTITWYLGTTTPSDALYYRNIKLPPGCRGSFELYATVAGTVLDNTGICNQATVFADEGEEDFLNNNTSTNCVTVRRADLAVRKRGVETSSGDAEFVEFGGLITYTVEYNNLGGFTAQDVVIRDYVPKGTTLVGVIPPDGATVTYSPNQAEAASFEVRFPSLTAPANSVGGIVSSNATPPGGGQAPVLHIYRVVDGAGVTTAANITWDAAVRGFILQVTSRLENDPSQTVWTDVSAQPAPFPESQQGVTLPIAQSSSNSMPNCFFRLKGEPVTGCSPGTNQYFASIQANCLLNWSRLFVKDNVPDGSVALYSVGRGTSGNVLFDLGPDFTHVPVGPEGLDVSGINPLFTDLVLQAEYALTTGTNSPCLEAWQFTYASPCWPSFTFTVRVDGSNANSCGPLPVPNTVSISTPTPEITLANNSTNYNMFTRLTDLQVTMAVDKAAALETESLTYTLRYLVAGPQGALGGYLRVAMPDWNGDGIAEVTLNSVVLPPNVTAYYHTASTNPQPPFDPNDPSFDGWTPTLPVLPNRANHLVFRLDDPKPDNTWTNISYTATVNNGTAGQTLNSSVAGFTARRESKCDNNSGSVVTYIGRLANVHLKKFGSGYVHPGNLVTFRIHYGNNGNTTAVNVVVSDVLPAGLTFDWADPLPSSVNGQNLTWNNLGTIPGTLSTGESSGITVVARLADDCALIGQTLPNIATITTSSEQVSLADDYAEASLNCITADVVSLGGYVYHDGNGNCLRGPGEAGIEGVIITLTGTVPCGDPVSLTALTDENGQYNFPGLPPGTYTLTETQPLPWFSTGDTLGSAGSDPVRGVNTNLLDDVLGPITLVGGEFGLEYNFCENTVSGCLRITNEVVTCLSNGTYSYTFCATNLFNGPISYLALLDLPPGVTATPDIVVLDAPWQPGEGNCFTVTIEVTGPPPVEMCFRVGAHTTDFIECCVIEHCLPLPLCCAQVVNNSAVPIPGQPNCYNYTFALRNDTTPPVPIQYLILLPDPANDCFHFTPDILFLTTPLLPGQIVTRTVKLCVTPPCPAPFCFVVSAHDTNFNLCCSVQHCLTNAPIHHRPVVFADGFEGSVYPAGTNIAVPLVIDTSVVQPNRVTVFEGTNVIRTILTPASGPLSVTWSNVSAGSYQLMATAQDEFGGIWSGDPARVSVLLAPPPAPAPSLLLAPPRLLSPVVAAGNVRFFIQADAGVTCHVEYTESLSSPAWTLMHRVVSDGSVMTVTDALTNAPQRFYRVRVN